jgi:hypothetical protein
MARKVHSTGSSSDFSWGASAWPTFLDLDIFDDEWAALELGDDHLQELQSAIRASPQRSPIIRGAEGLRKIRSRRPERRDSSAGRFASVMCGSASSGSSCW